MYMQTRYNIWKINEGEIIATFESDKDTLVEAIPLLFAKGLRREMDLFT